MMCKFSRLVMAKTGLSLTLILALIGGSLGGGLTAHETPSGNPWISFCPTEVVGRVALVNYDQKGIDDDLAYLLLVPACASFQEGRLFSSPLIFWDNERTIPELNSHPGVDYFLEDWMSFAPQSEVLAVGLPQEAIWELEDEGFSDIAALPCDPDSLSSHIALEEWGESKEAVVAVLDMGRVKEVSDRGTIQGRFDFGPEVKSREFEGKKEPTLVPTYHKFDVSPPTKYIQVKMNWQERGKDPDLQLYDFSLGEVAASARWNVIEGRGEEVVSYANNYGEWAAAVTYMPTQSIKSPPKKAQHDLQVDYQVKVKMYPGVEVMLPPTPQGCHNARLELQGKGKLGLVVRGLEGAELASAIPYRKPLEMEYLGKGEYTATVLALEGEVGPDFALNWSWEGREDGFTESMAAASNGAVLASLKNCPLFYAHPEGISPGTEAALEKLGVKEIHLLNLSGREVDIASFPVSELETLTDIYQAIRDISGSDDIVFSTTKPFSYPDALGDFHTQEGGYFFAPGAYASAIHGSPLLLLESDPRLECAALWHRSSWRRGFEDRHTPPSPGGMVLTGREVYSFLEDMGMDQKGKERILTMAGEFELGPSWDRVFPGKAIAGRIWGTPVDCAFWFARNAFYPALIFVNPALSKDGIYLIQGSSSHREGQRLIIDDLGGEEKFNCPCLQTWVCYEHRFNELAPEYWGLAYETTSGQKPFWTKTGASIDSGVNEKYGRKGSYLPDMSSSEVVPFYLEKGGFDSVFSTSFNAATENLNRGAILWFEGMHGGNMLSGTVGFWNEIIKTERNPWRGYEYLGCTQNPDTAAMSRLSGIDVEKGSDGVVISIWEQLPQTFPITGDTMDKYLENIHSCGIVAGSCLIAHTFLHLSFIRHGSTFQVIAPWSASWYISHAQNMIARSIAQGKDMGQAYEEAILEVGIGYLTEGWWWDTYENIVYYGDPNLRVYSGAFPWPRPEVKEGKEVR